MKKKFLAPLIIVGLLFSFAAGTLAASNWMNFTGDAVIEESETQVDEIMDILRQVNEDKLTAEEALAELEALNPPGLVKKIKELEREIERLKTDNAQLVTDLNAKQNEINEKNTQIDNLQTENDALKATIDNLNAEIDNLNAQLDSSGDYIEHLEAELERANQKAESINQVTSEAIEEAREIAK